MSWVLPQPPSGHPTLHSSRLFAKESSLVSRSWWARWQMGLKLSLSTSVPNCSWRGRNLLRPPDCFWYVLTSLPKVFPYSNYCVNRVIIHVGGPLLRVKTTCNTTYSIPCCFRNWPFGCNIIFIKITENGCMCINILNACWNFRTNYCFVFLYAIM